jgi:serine protease AprX
MGNTCGRGQLAGHRSTSLSRKGIQLVALLAFVATLLVPAAASADGAPTTQQPLIAAAQSAPNALFDVLVVSSRSNSSAAAAQSTLSAISQKPSKSSASALGSQITDRFTSVPAVAARLTGAQVLALARDSSVSIGSDTPVVLTGIDNKQTWYDTVQAHWYKDSPILKSTSGSMPTVAIIDSGVDPAAANLGARFLGQVDLASLAPNSAGDGWGHGTMVASLAASSDDHYAGIGPTAKLLSLDVVNDLGEARTSDVIAAADWILQNRSAYNIRVANLSLQESLPSSFLYDPLDAAVEKLWQAGVVVVAAAGNYAVNGEESGVGYAPANDPFVISVGATDVGGSPDPKDDTAAPWSAYGYTPDGFRKPELSAPGRYMIAGVPVRSALALKGGQNPKLVKQGFLQLSGTSFAAPIVSGAAAALIGADPNWTPDQVKGALMLGANALPKASQWSAGVGELNLKTSLNLKTDPPNPNVSLNRFLISDPQGGALPVFDREGWLTAVSNASWTDMSATNAAWGSAAWGSAAWGSAAWGSAAWGSAAWSSAAWGSAAWGSGSWSAATFVPPVNVLAFADYAQQDDGGNG